MFSHNIDDKNDPEVSFDPKIKIPNEFGKAFYIPILDIL